MKLFSKATVLILLAAGLAGCTNSDQMDNEQTKNDSAFQINMEQTAFALKQWKTDGSHRSSVSGTFMQGDQPVVNAVLHAGDSKRDIRTGEDGSFQILIDQSLIRQTNVHVVSLDHATVDGKAIAQDQTDQAMAASTDLKVHYPVSIQSAAVSGEDPDKTIVQGRIIADKTASVAYFQEDKFRIGGIVKDADGKPVQGAVVWIDRDSGEGFAKSTPTDKNGNYAMYYLPEDDETNLSVTIGTVNYTLPDNKVFRFPVDTSLKIDIILPREGTVIDDKPPTLESRTDLGSLYAGLLVGIDVAEDVSYTVTVPNAEGYFSLTLPTEVWERNPTFFETNMTTYIENELKAGDSLPSSFIEISPDAPHHIKGEFAAQ